MDFLKDICDLWLKEQKRCAKHKAKHFGNTADKLRGFLGKSYRELYIETEDADLRSEDTPWFKPRLNKTREFVSVVLPFIHAKVPTRTVTPDRPPLPGELMQLFGQSDAEARMWEKAQCYLAKWWLNYIPDEYGAKREQRQILEECLVTGRGVGWHEMAPGPTGDIPATYFDSVDNLFIDAECVHWREANFIIRRRAKRAWEIADQFGIPVKAIRAARKNAKEVAEKEGVSEPWMRENDQCVYYEYWSRMGLGNRLAGASEDIKERSDAFDRLGRHVFLSILPGLDYPLNLPKDVLPVASADEILGRLSWPLAFFEDLSNPFPCTPCDIYPATDSAWATSPLEAAIPLQVFLDRLYAMLMGRVRATCRDLIFTAKELEDQVQQAIEEGKDQIVVAMEGTPGDDIERLVHVLQFPPINVDAWQVLNLVTRAFEQATGMDPLLYGSEGARQIRSAEEVNIRGANVQSRPGDYADAAEEFNSQAGAKELQLSRLYVAPHTVAPLFAEPAADENGEPLDESMYGPLTNLWASLINTDDPAEACSDMRVQVEAGSGMRKNKQKMASDLQAISQYMLPTIQSFVMSGFTEPWNAFVDAVSETHEIDLSRMKLPPMDLNAAQQQGKSQEKMAEAEMEAEQAELDREASLEETIVKAEAMIEAAKIRAKSSGGE